VSVEAVAPTSAPREPEAWVFDAIGTRWQIDTDREVPSALRQAIAARIDQFDRDYSRFREDSLVTRLARSAGAYRVPADAQPLIDVYERLYRATSGAVTPFVGDTLVALGYDAQYSLVPAAAAAAAVAAVAPAGQDVPATVPRLADVVADASALRAGSVVHTTRPVTVDVGAAGKGYLVDLVAALLDDAGFDTFTVDASGDLFRRGTPIRVALEHPYDPSKAIGVVELGDAALCASATNRRAWGNGLHHVIDGRTGLPTPQVAATWTLAADARTADGVATALFFTDPTVLREEFGTDGVRIFSSGRLERTPTFQGEIFV
jgi:thiamine biosynthesis lipoprotein